MAFPKSPGDRAGEPGAAAEAAGEHLQDGSLCACVCAPVCNVSEWLFFPASPSRLSLPLARSLSTRSLLSARHTDTWHGGKLLMAAVPSESRELGAPFALSSRGVLPHHLLLPLEQGDRSPSRGSTGINNNNNKTKQTSTSSPVPLKRPAPFFPQPP